MEPDLASRLQLWNSSAGGLEVLASSAGRWAPSPACAAPRLIVLLYGHFRSMQATARPLREMAEASSPGCHLLAAVLPEGVNVNYSHFYKAQRAAGRTTTRQEAFEVRHSHRKWARFDAGAVAAATGGVAAALGRMQRDTFGGALAYAVVGRWGDVNRYPYCLPVYWHAVWALADWATQTMRLEMRADAVVLRTRPDVLWEGRHAVRFGLERLQRHFGTPEGERMLLGQETDRPNAQGDILLFTSWGAYERHIALPLQEARARLLWHSDLPTARLLWNLGLRNGWGYGRSMLGGGAASEVLPLLNRCVCLAGGASCARPSCLLPVTEAYAYASKYVLRQGGRNSSSSSSSSSSSTINININSNNNGASLELAGAAPRATPRRVIELGEALYSYCPNFPNASITLPPGGAHRISKPWLLGGTYRCKTRRALAAHPSPHDIYVTGTVSRELWPAGCGPSNFLTDRIVALPPRAGDGGGGGRGRGGDISGYDSGGGGGDGGGGGGSGDGGGVWPLGKPLPLVACAPGCLDALERYASKVLSDIPPDPVISA